MIRIIGMAVLIIIISCSTQLTDDLIFDGESTKDVIRFNKQTGAFWHPTEDVGFKGKYCSGVSGYYCFIDLNQVGFVFSVPIFMDQEKWSFDGSNFKIRTNIKHLLDPIKASNCPESKLIGVYRSGETILRYNFYYSQECGVFGYCYPNKNNQQCFWSRGQGITLIPDLNMKNNQLLLSKEQELLVSNSMLDITNRSTMIVRDNCLINGKCGGKQ